MNRLADLLLDVLDDLPFAAGGAEAGTLVSVDGLDLSMPVETRVAADGTVLASAPRNRLSTGFDPALHTLRVRIRRTDA